MLRRSVRVWASTVLAFALAACAAPEISHDGARAPAPAEIEARVQRGDAEAACAALLHTEVGGGVINGAHHIAQGAAYGEGAAAALHLQAPADFCRVTATLHPVANSEIQVEVWLPDSWNRKFLAVGGGGFSGGLASASASLRPALGGGYVAAATDVGHPESYGAAWALNQPERITDWAHRGNHLTAVFARALISAYYSQPLQRAYFQGCSNGGRDALMEARRYPDDYDGIIAGAPAANWTAMAASFVDSFRTLYATPGAANLPSKVGLIGNAVRAQCDAQDGVSDGIINDPRACAFDPARLQCTAGDAPTCLTAAEVAGLRRVYAGAHLRNGVSVYPGFSVGGEDIPENALGWRNSGNDGAGALGQEFFRNMVFSDAHWSDAQFDFDRDYAVARQRLGPVVDAVDPDISAFVRRGGKLILFHGWADGLIPPEATLRYYQSVQQRIGAATSAHVRLFMAPGMGHCFSGPGPNNFDMLSEIDRWSETGTAPDRVIATKYDNDLMAMLGAPAHALRTRPLCAWPKRAHYNGSGSSDDAANFSCR
ncbi:MAG: tannase/feruloyl esterase family alpha/beta hydrolase [Terricaulis sp.]